MHKYQGAIALEDLFSSSMSKTDVFSKLCKIGPIFFKLKQARTTILFGGLNGVKCC
jgi:hypothetical protein